MTPQSFRGHTFQVVTGTTHPAYSLETFSREENDFRERFWTISPGDVVVDAGASYGSYTLTALVSGAAHVYSFEPEPSVFVDLQRNLAANNWSDRCTAANMGLWDRPERIHMGSYAPHWPPLTITGDYSMTRLDDAMRDVPRVDWLKIDVEGAETRALLGAQETLKRCRPRVIVECHVFLNPMLTEICKALLDGYDFIEIPREECTLLIAIPFRRWNSAELRLLPNLEPSK